MLQPLYLHGRHITNRTDNLDVDDRNSWSKMLYECNPDVILAQNNIRSVEEVTW
jgi:hypothetical protein